MEQGWIGVDLDGTLAVYEDWIDINHVGEPVPLMMERVEAWIKQGIRVKIFTARCEAPGHEKPIQKWLKKHGLPQLEITNVKDFGMIELWDDRCIQVIKNTGKTIKGVWDDSRT